MKKKIFLTGVNGYLGSHVALKLVNQGHHVVGLIRGDTLPPNLKNYHIEYCKGDLLNPESYNSALKKCHVVIHTAAVAAFGVKRPQDYYRINTDGTRLLLESSKKNDIERFIHTSTRGTLGVAEAREQSDETCNNKQIDEMDDYIRSKYLAEMEVVKYSKREAMFCSVLSPTALVGAYDCKPTPVGRIIVSFLRGKVFMYMNGGINLIDVEDAAQAFVEALDKGENGQVYILGNENITLYELFKKLSMISSLPPPRIKIPYTLAYAGSVLIKFLSKAMGVSPFATPAKVLSLYKGYSYCTSQKAVQTFGLSQSPIDLALTKAANWYRENSYFSAGTKVH